MLTPDLGGGFVRRVRFESLFEDCCLTLSIRAFLREQIGIAGFVFCVLTA